MRRERSGRLSMLYTNHALLPTRSYYKTDVVHSLERVIRDLAAAKESNRIKKIIQQLCNDFAYAVHQPHARNGGLIGLAAAAIALGPVC